MSEALRERVARALHIAACQAADEVDTPLMGWESCGETVRSFRYRSADAVLAELGLTEEWGVRCSFDHEDVTEAEDREDAERVKQHHDSGDLGCEHTLVRRHVTPWTEVEG